MSGDVSQWARGLIWSCGGRRKTILRGYGFLMTFYAIFVFLSRSKARKTTSEFRENFFGVADMKRDGPIGRPQENIQFKFKVNWQIGHIEL